MKYKNIIRAGVEIAYDNGFINQSMPEEEWVGYLERYLEENSSALRSELYEMDRWLGTLSDEDFSIVASGEEDEMYKLLAECPHGEKLNAILDTFFSLEY